MNDKIADRLDGMECGSVTVRRGTTLDDTWLTLTQRNSVEECEDSITFSVDGFVAFCRAVVERVDDGKKTITLNFQAKKEASHDDK